jgi:hypothetical protein
MTPTLNPMNSAPATSDFATYMAQDRRLVILSVLKQSALFRANEFLIKSMLERLGHAVSTDRVHTDLAWLVEQGLIALETVADVQIAWLLIRGEDVVRGLIEVPGVKRPSPQAGA